MPRAASARCVAPLRVASVLLRQSRAPPRCRLVWGGGGELSRQRRTHFALLQAHRRCPEVAHRWAGPAAAARSDRRHEGDTTADVTWRRVAMSTWVLMPARWCAARERGRREVMWVADVESAKRLRGEPSSNCVCDRSAVMARGERPAGRHEAGDGRSAVWAYPGQYSQDAHHAFRSRQARSASETEGCAPPFVATVCVWHPKENVDSTGSGEEA